MLDFQVPPLFIEFSRNWKELLEKGAVEEIDKEIALVALKKELPQEVTRIIYFGSPHAQELEEEQRISYAISITGEVQKVRREQNWIWIKPDTIGYVLIDGCFKGYIAFSSKTRANKYLKWLKQEGTDSLEKGKILSGDSPGIKVVGKWAIEIVSFNPDIAINIFQELTQFDLSKDPNKQPTVSY